MTLSGRNVHAHAFVRELEELGRGLVASLCASGQAALEAAAAPGRGAEKLFELALANELGVSELAGSWIGSTSEVDVKVAFARQAGDEASHFTLIEERLRALGSAPATLALPRASPLFDYLRSLGGTVERIAAGLFTLESIAHGVNENFMALCARSGDHETVRIYREHIQPDERAHHRLGCELLARHATLADHQVKARETVLRTFELAAAGRAKAALALGTACLPGC